jgi:hypothetical protein
MASDCGEDAPFGEVETPQRRRRISEQFSPRPVAMQKSAPYKVLNGSELKMLDRIEIELANHGGNDNGRLPVTSKQFEEYGLRRALLAASRRALVALGFITFAPGLVSAVADKRRPSLFGLTYRHMGDAKEPAHGWRKIDDLGEAVRVANEARDTLDEGRQRPRRMKPVLRLISGKLAVSAGVAV